MTLLELLEFLINCKALRTRKILLTSESLEKIALQCKLYAVKLTCASLKPFDVRIPLELRVKHFPKFFPKLLELQTVEIRSAQKRKNKSIKVIVCILDFGF